MLLAPVGESGGVMGNSIVGIAKLLLLASLIGVPIGFFGAIYLAEFSGGTTAFVIRYAADLLNGVPSIVIGIFAYGLLVLPFKHFSTVAGGFALGLMMIPSLCAARRSFSAVCPAHSVKPPWPWGQQMENRRHGHRPGCLPRNSHRGSFGLCTRCRRNRAASLHRIWQSLLESRLGPAHGFPPGYDLYLCHRSV